MNSADILIALFSFGVGLVCAAVGYAQGHRDGKREGYLRGRSLMRRASSKEVQS